MSKLSDLLPKEDQMIESENPGNVIKPEEGMYTIEELLAMRESKPPVNELQVRLHELAEEELTEAKEVLEKIAAGEMEPLGDVFPIPSEFDENGLPVFERAEKPKINVAPTPVEDLDEDEDDIFLPGY